MKFPHVVLLTVQSTIGAWGRAEPPDYQSQDSKPAAWRPRARPLPVAYYQWAMAPEPQFSMVLKLKAFSCRKSYCFDLVSIGVSNKSAVIIGVINSREYPAPLRQFRLL